MTFRAPVEEILFALRYAAGFERSSPMGESLADGTAEAILRQAAKFADDVLEPLNGPGDRIGAQLSEGKIVTPPGWRAAYEIWRAGGWAGLAAPEDYGGAGLPHLLNAACLDAWNAANVAFMLGPVLSFAAIDALAAHASSELRETYLRKLISGEWTATMNLTEPQAGSDLAALRTKAARAPDGTYLIAGQKIFITYGDHDLSDNIVHLVLARLPDAPAGTRGVSLFLVPKFLVEADGSLGARNDLRCAGVEHKMGIHGAPTCTMVFGDGGGAKAWLVGEENRGLACMFTMMNNARLAVGLQGVGLCEAATQKAIAFARERRQGRASGETHADSSAIIAHPDVRRMLMTMKASTAAARAICYLTAAATDRGAAAQDEAARRAAANRASLLTPIAKAFATDLANETTSLGVQVHGGMGYIEETGAAQLMRDARIAAIYEGTNGIQAIDLVQRKLPMEGGETVRLELALMRDTIEALLATNAPEFGASAARLGEAIECLARATEWMLQTLPTHVGSALAGATPYLRLFGLARGGASLADLALEAHRQIMRGDSDPLHAGRIALARFFAENLAVAASGLESAIVSGADSTLACEQALGGGQ
ncbi:MAG TPA: acyl-CoA dehydrogenase [Beijerinckiaceae bacterium]|nr:acyl-CoA dehydrogenase [Beijerinckiaceae bacterium]